MQNEEEEIYVSLRMACSDIQETIQMLNLAKTQTNVDIKTALVKLSVITYCKPFKTINGVYKKKFKPLNKDTVFPCVNHDHNALIRDRDQYFAHGDLSAYDPRLSYSPPWNTFVIRQRPSHLFDRIDQQIEKMLALCDIVLKYLEDQIQPYHKKFREELAQTESEGKLSEYES
jgi:hypothetical protein